MSVSNDGALRHEVKESAALPALRLDVNLAASDNFDICAVVPDSDTCTSPTIRTFCPADGTAPDFQSRQRGEARTAGQTQNAVQRLQRAFGYFPVAKLVTETFAPSAKAGAGSASARTL